MIEAKDCKQSAKAITTNTVELPQSAPRTKAWDPSRIITTGNIEQVQAANQAAAAKKGKK